MLRNKLSLLSDLDVCLTELLLCNFARSAAEEILCITVHRECDDFSDVLLAAEDHDHTVNAGSHACVGRSTVSKGIVHCRELRLHVLCLCGVQIVPLVQGHQLLHVQNFFH